MAQDSKEDRTIEAQELNRLIDRGIKFNIRRRIMCRRPGFLGRFRKKVSKEESFEFEIHELTLHTLDVISAEGVMMEINETDLQSDNGALVARAMVRDHAVRMAKVLAIAVMNRDYEIPVKIGDRTKYVVDEPRLKELTQLFAHTIEPSKLFQMCIAINTMSNLGDFTNCIRLTSANRTTIPDRIQD